LEEGEEALEFSILTVQIFPLKSGAWRELVGAEKESATHISYLPSPTP